MFSRIGGSERRTCLYTLAARVKKIKTRCPRDNKLLKTETHRFETYTHNKRVRYHVLRAYLATILNYRIRVASITLRCVFRNPNTVIHHGVL